MAPAIVRVRDGVAGRMRDDNLVGGLGGLAVAAAAGQGAVKTGMTVNLQEQYPPLLSARIYNDECCKDMGTE